MGTFRPLKMNVLRIFRSVGNRFPRDAACPRGTGPSALQYFLNSILAKNLTLSLLVTRGFVRNVSANGFLTEVTIYYLCVPTNARIFY